MSEKFPTLSEIRTILEVSEARIIAALRAPAPTPAPDPMPDGGAGKIRVAFGFRGDRPLHVGDTGILHGTCEGFDPRKTGAVILDPDNEPITVDRVEVLHNGPVISHDPPYYDTIALVATWTPKKEYAAGSALSFVTGVAEPAVVPLAVTITAPPQREVARPIDPPAGTWPRPTEAQYLAGDKLPVCRSNEDVALARERIKLGRLPWVNSLAEGPTAVISFKELMAGYDRIEGSKPDWALTENLDSDVFATMAILGPKADLPSWDDPYAGGSTGTATLYGRVDRLRNLPFAKWLVGAWSDPGGKPSGV